MTMQETGLPKISSAYSLTLGHDGLANLFTRLSTAGTSGYDSSVASGSINNGQLVEGFDDPGAGWYTSTPADKPKEYELPLSSLTHEFDSENIPIPLPTDNHILPGGGGENVLEEGDLTIPYNRLYQLRNARLRHAV